MNKQSFPLFQRNREVFETRYPDVWRCLDGIEGPIAKRIEKDGSVVNLDLGGGMLYPLPAPKWTEEQLRSFRQYPERIGFPDPSHCNLSAISLELLNSLTAYSRDNGLTGLMAGLPVVDVGYLFVFGIGLGHHIRELVEETPAKHIVLIEPVREFLLHALSAIDWGDVVAVADRREIILHFVLADDPDKISAKVEEIVSIQGNTFLDGSYFCPHYYSWTLKEAFVILKERLKNYYISSGFIEDEIEMVRNSIRNLDRWPVHLVESRAFREQNLPVFILGAGPSIDKDLPEIRRLRDRVIVISCGTALGILLKNGIRPDIHCELERGGLTYTILSGVRDEYGFDGITLLASTTVDPRVSELFEKRWYFFRAGLSPAVLLNDEVVPLHGADPLVCNAAFSAAAHLGFTQIYLFGIDLAQKEKGQHHAKDSVYFKEQHADLDDIYVKRFDRKVPGNFGGTVETFWAFDMGRQMLSQVQRLRPTNLVNCSDGAKIYGAKPRVAAAVSLPDILPRREDVLARVEAQMPAFEAGELLRKVDLDTHVRGCEDFVEAFEEFLVTVLREDAGFVDMEARLHDFVTERRADFRGFFSLALSSMVSMLRLGSFFASRISDEAKRRAFFENFIDHYRERCIKMTEISKDLLSSVGEGTKETGKSRSQRLARSDSPSSPAWAITDTNC